MELVVRESLGSGGDGGLDMGPWVSGEVEGAAESVASEPRTPSSGETDGAPVGDAARVVEVDDVAAVADVVARALADVGLVVELLLGGVVVRTWMMPSFPEHAARLHATASTSPAVAPAVRAPRRPRPLPP